MRTYDFSPMFRSVVGFDRLNRMLESALEVEEGGWPPYNIEKTGDDSYRITMALAGFTPQDIEVVVKEGTLTISGNAARTEEEKAKTYLYRGIATRAFERRFQLADHIKVGEAKLANGLLAIDLTREVPEAAKPKVITVKADTTH
jgi:molecular chaperone IbpA